MPKGDKKMDELQAARAEIDQVDEELAKLFCRRMDAVRAVAAYKQARGLPVLDAGREEAVVEKNLKKLPQPAYAPYYEDFLRHNMALSRAMQTAFLGRDAVAYQGVEGAFSHIVLKTLYPYARALPFATWGEVFDAVEAGRAAFGVLPFENSFAGDVSEVLDLCFAHPQLCVCGMYDLPVRQNLLGVPGATLGGVRRAVSHPQALRQSERFLKSLSIEAVSCSNTAEAAKRVAEAGDPSLAAIASLETAQLYGLTVLAGDVNTSADNTTRFIVIGKQLPPSGDRFSLLFVVDHRPGTLAGVIRAIGEKGYNLECIKSRPHPGKPWEYYFYVEVVGGPGDVEALTESLSGLCRTVRVLGIYSR